MKPSELITLGLTAILCGVALTAATPPNWFTVPLFFILTVGGSFLLARGVRDAL